MRLGDVTSVKFGFIFYLFMSGSPSVFGTSILGGTTEDLAAGAHWIAEVEIEAVSSEHRSAIATQVTAKVLQVFKGGAPSGSRVQFSIPGGVIGKRRLSVLGMVSFQVGDTHIIYLDRDPSVRSTALQAAGGSSLFQWSAHRVYFNDRTSEKMVVRAGTLTLAKRGSANALSLGHDQRAQKFDDFVTDLYRGMNR